jgi:hypothetical protein
MIGRRNRSDDGSGLRSAALEQIGQDRVIHDAQKQTNRWTHENAADRACLDRADARVAQDASNRRGHGTDEA